MDNDTIKKIIRNVLILLGVLTAIIIAVNKFIAIFSDMSEDDVSEKERVFKWKYGDIFYVQAGKGTPLVLIHDMDVFSSSYEWDKTIKSLAKKNTVYAIDLLGCGKSDKPNITYTNFLYVQLLNEFIKKVIGRKTNVIATGDSLSFTIMACQMDNSLYNKIIGVTPADLYELSKTPGKRKNLVKYLIELPVIGTFIYNVETGYLHIRHILQNERFFKSSLVSKETALTYFKNAHSGNNGSKYLLASKKAHYTNININNAVKNIDNSLYLIGGKEDPIAEDIIDEYIELNPSIEAVYMDNAAMLPQLETPDEFLRTVDILLHS